MGNYSLAHANLGGVSNFYCENVDDVSSITLAKWVNPKTNTDTKDTDWLRIDEVGQAGLDHDKPGPNGPVDFRYVVLYRADPADGKVNPIFKPNGLNKDFGFPTKKVMKGGKSAASYCESLKKICINQLGPSYDYVRVDRGDAAGADGWLDIAIKQGDNYQTCLFNAFDKSKLDVYNDAYTVYCNTRSKIKVEYSFFGR